MAKQQRRRDENDEAEKQSGEHEAPAPRPSVLRRPAGPASWQRALADDGRGLGIAGTARKPGSAGTLVAPEVRAVQVDRPQTAPRQAPPQPAAPPTQPEAAGGARPVVRVTLAQAAAAGHQTVRPMAPTRAPAIGRTVQAAAPAQKREEARPREIPPVVPLAVPATQVEWLQVQGLGSPAAALRLEQALLQVPGVREVGANPALDAVAVAPAGIDRAALAAAAAAAGHPTGGAPGAGKLLAAAGATAALGLVSHLALGPTTAGAAVASLGLATAWPVGVAALRQLLRGRPAPELLPLAASVAILAAAHFEPGAPALATVPLVIHLLAAAAATALGGRARRLVDTVRERVPAKAAAGRIEVEAGAVIPADGRLLTPAILDESALGGDDDTERLAGEAVTGGAIARTAATLVAAPGTGRLARCVEVATRALATRAPAGALAARLLLPVALVVAAGAAVLGDLWAGAAVLAGASPLALALGPSLAAAAGISRAATRGVAVRSAEALDRAGKSDTVILDKSTTLTRGDAAVLEFLAKPGRDAREVLAAAASAEAGIDHGVARALANHAADLRVSLRPATGTRHEPGRGVVAQVDGRQVLVGSVAFATGEGIDPGLLVQQVDELARRGRTPLLVAFDGEAVAVIGIADTPHESARQAVGSLELLDVDIQVASGDAGHAVQWLGEAIGLDRRAARGDLAPAEKKALVDSLRADGPVIAAGARAADLQALRAADLPVAAAAEPEVEATAGALLVRQDPQGVVELVRAGRAMRRGSGLALAAALGGNGAAMGLAAAGAVQVPGAAAIALLATSLSLLAAASPWVRIR